MTREIGLLLSPNMARAYRDGRKHMTRRVVKPQPPADAERWGPNSYEGPEGPSWWWFKGNIMVKKSCIWPDPKKNRPMSCPYGKRGNILRLKTTWAVPAMYDTLPPCKLPADVLFWSIFDGDKKPEGFGRLRPGRFCPKFLWRNLPACENAGVRVERVQDITVKDAIHEGIDHDATPAELALIEATGQGDDRHIETFADLWDSINAQRGYGYDENPWVWVVMFGDRL